MNIGCQPDHFQMFRSQQYCFVVRHFPPTVLNVSFPQKLLNLDKLNRTNNVN